MCLPSIPQKVCSMSILLFVGVLTVVIWLRLLYKSGCLLNTPFNPVVPLFLKWNQHVAVIEHELTE